MQDTAKYVHPPGTVNPCPFCGNANDQEKGRLAEVVIWAYTVGGEKGRAFVVRCVGCRAEGPTAFEEQEAVQLWNARTIPVTRECEQR
jgi:hypothetical protein